MELTHPGFRRMVSHVDDEGNTALMIAANMQMEQLAVTIVETGSAAPGNVSNAGLTAILVACLHNMPQLAATLISTGHSNPGHANQAGVTPLLLACGNGMDEIALQLIETGESRPEAALYANNKTALMTACQNGMVEVAERILATGSSAPGTKSINGETALMYACANGDHDILDVACRIFETGLSDPTCVSLDGNSAIAFLLSRQNIDSDIFRILLRHYVLEASDDVHFNTVVLPYICESSIRSREVWHSAQLIPDLAGSDLGAFCAPLVDAEAELVLPDYAVGKKASMAQLVSVPFGGITHSRKPRSTIAELSGQRTRRRRNSFTIGERNAHGSPFTSLSRRRLTRSLSPVVTSRLAHEWLFGHARPEQGDVHPDEEYEDMYFNTITQRMEPIPHDIVDDRLGVRIQKRMGGTKKSQGKVLRKGTKRRHRVRK
jgi:hypothetical protein